VGGGGAPGGAAGGRGGGGGGRRGHPPPPPPPASRPLTMAGAGRAGGRWAAAAQATQVLNAFDTGHQDMIVRRATPPPRRAASLPLLLLT